MSGGLFAVTWALGFPIGDAMHFTVDLPLPQVWGLTARDAEAVPWKETGGVAVIKVPLALGLGVGF